jgi:hypothetical protein
MSKLEPMVFICFPETHKTCVNFQYSLLPRWMQLYIMRWWERKHKDAAT